MTTSKANDDRQAFAVWLTGRPAAGKSTITAALVELLKQHGIDPAVLESDAMRRVLTPRATYSDEERDTFYGALLHIGRMFYDHRVPVIFDATANRRRYRDAARAALPRFMEVFVDCPVKVTGGRDPKGLYAEAAKQAQGQGTLPGVHAEYEPPLQPEVTIHSDKEAASDAASRIVQTLEARGFLPAGE